MNTTKIVLLWEHDRHLYDYPRKKKSQQGILDSRGTYVVELRGRLTRLSTERRLLFVSFVHQKHLTCNQLICITNPSFE